MKFSITIKSDTQHNNTQHNNTKTRHLSIRTLDTAKLSVIYGVCRYAECHSCWVSQISSLCRVSLCWMSLCWMSLCWVSWRLIWRQSYKTFLYSTDDCKNGATTLSIMTCSMRTLCRATLNIMVLFSDTQHKWRSAFLTLGITSLSNEVLLCWVWLLRHNKVECFT